MTIQLRFEIGVTSNWQVQQPCINIYACNDRAATWEDVYPLPVVVQRRVQYILRNYDFREHSIHLECKQQEGFADDLKMSMDMILLEQNGIMHWTDRRIIK